MREPPPLVSCIVPVNNGERYLGEAIDSILRQRHRPLEIIVVDNGSSDGSAALGESYGDPVRVIRQEDRGPPGGRNTGIREARGEFICMLDADDVFTDDKLERQLERFRSRPELHVCLAHAENFWEPGLEDEERIYRAHGKILASHVFGTMLTVRSVFETVGLIDAARIYGDQVDWFARMADAGVISEVLPDVLMRRRMHRASLSHNAPDLDDYVDLVKARLDRRRRDGPQSDRGGVGRAQPGLDV